jgi:hypothetical protein
MLINGKLVNPITLKPFQYIPTTTRQMLKNLKRGVGLYFLYNEEKQLIYIGKSFDLCKRIKGSAYHQRATYFKYLETKNEADANILEPYFIMKFNPPQNIHFNIRNKPTIKIRFPITEPAMELVKIFDFSDEGRVMELPESTGGASGELTPGNGIGPRKALSERGERINGHLRRIK